MTRKGNKMNKLEILVGNIGAGKSTSCKDAVKDGYVILSKDNIRYMLGAGTYIFDENLEMAIHRGITSMLCWLMAENVDIIIDETNMNRASRKEALECAKAYNYETIAVIFPKLSKNVSVARRLSSNHGNTPKAVWEEVWERKNSEYEGPTHREGFNQIIFKK